MTLLTCTNLTVSIQQQHICKNLQLSIDASDCWGLLGQNGSGKTTLLKTLAGLKKPAHGEIFLKNKNITTLSRKEIALQLGILFQDTNMAFDQTVLEYCLLGRHPHLSRFQSPTKQDQALCLSALKAMELEHLSMRNVTTLSGGERRRLSIALLMAQSPAVYLLDEPTNHLDLRHQWQVLSLFKNFSSAAIFMALHDVRFAQAFCNKIMLLFPDGEILIGSTIDLLTDANLSRLYQLPLGWFKDRW